MASRKPAYSSIPEGKARLNLLIDADLKDWAQDFASNKRTNLTAIITRYLTNLQELERSQGSIGDIEGSLLVAAKELETNVNSEITELRRMLTVISTSTHSELNKEVSKVRQYLEGSLSGLKNDLVESGRILENVRGLLRELENDVGVEQI